MKKLVLLLIVISFFDSCKLKTEAELTKQWKNEIIKTEQAFYLMAEKEGISKAFLTYASKDAVLMRNDKLIKGKNAMHSYFENLKNTKDVTLKWKPNFVDVSKSGDLGYTYGNYVYSYKNNEGEISKTNGVFHTVWKRQPNGDWKFVWD
jgi:ketosteroid isomerase-like protein